MKSKNNKVWIPLIGLIIVCLGLGFMLYGMNNNETLYNVGIGLNIAGLFLSSIGLIFTSSKRKK